MDDSSGGFIDGGGGGGGGRPGCAPLLALVNRGVGEGVQNIKFILLLRGICDEKCFLYLDHSIS